MNQLFEKFDVFLLILAFVGSLLAGSQVNYDTAWMFIYDGGKDSTSGKFYVDYFYDVKSLPNGACICAGYTGNSSLLIKLDKSGDVVLEKAYNTSHTRGIFNSQATHSVFIAKNSDIILGGQRYSSPWVMRLDSVGHIKWTAWYYDSTQGAFGEMLNSGATINSIRETSRGRIICTAGDKFPNGSGTPLRNYAAYLEYDSSGNMTNWGQWDDEVGYKIAGFSIDEISENRYMIAGNQALITIDTAGTLIFSKSYGFMLEGVGSVKNRISRVNKFRDGTLMVAGQAYEGRCWINYQRYSYDAWWSPISPAGGGNTAWDTAGWQGMDDFLYDFTQLSDGRLVFIGKKSQFPGTIGDPSHRKMWAFVTDSTGKEILWEKELYLFYRTIDGTDPSPFSVCATPDTGFTVVGADAFNENGETNAFAAHFIPTTPTKAVNNLHSTTIQDIRFISNGSIITFSFQRSTPARTDILIFNAVGKLVARLSTNQGSMPISTALVWDSSRSARGIYFYRVKSDVFQGSGKFILN